MPAPSLQGRRRQHKFVVLLDANENRKLNRLSQRTGLTKSDLFRQYIRKEHQRLVSASSAGS